MATKPKGKTRNGTIVGRNANGEGSVYYDASKDRWRATYVDSINGARRTVLGRTRAEAASRRDRKVAEGATAIAPKVPTVETLCTWWLDNVADVRPNTLNNYKVHCRHITEHLGNIPINEVDVEVVRIFLSGLRETHGDHAVSNIRSRLSQICKEAVALGHLASNPVTLVAPPRKKAAGESSARRVLTPDDVHRLIAACADHPYGAGVAMLFTMGNRSSEVLGLAWSDIDLDAGTAIVQRGSTNTGKGIGQRLDATKTSGTRGLHHLGPTVIELLKARKADQDTDRMISGDLWEWPQWQGNPLDVVFTDRNGRLLRSQHLYRAVKDCCTTAKIDPTKVGTHTGRRSVITALYEEGLALEDIAGHVGHTQTSTTSGYVQGLGERPAKTAAIAAGLLDPNSR